MPRGEKFLPESLLDRRLLLGVGGLLDALLPGAELPDALLLGAGLPGLLSTFKLGVFLLVGVAGFAEALEGVFTGSELLDLLMDGGFVGVVGTLAGFFAEALAMFPTDRV